MSTESSFEMYEMLLERQQAQSALTQLQAVQLQELTRHQGAVTDAQSQATTARNQLAMSQDQVVQLQASQAQAAQTTVEQQHQSASAQMARQVAQAQALSRRGGQHAHREIGDAVDEAHGKRTTVLRLKRRRVRSLNICLCLSVSVWNSLRSNRVTSLHR